MSSAVGSRHIPFTADVQLANGSEVLWSQREGKYVPRVCGGCGNKRVVRIPNHKARKTWTALCRSCRHRRLRADTTLPGGGTLEREGQSSGKAWRTCGKCGKREYITIQYRADWSGNCFDCAHRKRTGERPHKSGAEILFDDRSQKHYQKIAFICANAGCKKKDFTWDTTLANDDWHGLCSTCRRASVHPLALIKDEKIKNSNTVIFWSRRDGNKVPVRCGCCGRERNASVKGTLSRHRIPSWTGYCLECLRNPPKALAALQSALVSTNQETDTTAPLKVEEKRRRGPEKGSHAIITEVTVAEAFKQVAGFPTQEKVAEVLGVTDRAIRDWLKQNGSNWRQIQQSFINRK